MTPVSHELAVHSTRGDVHVYDPYAHYTLCGRRWWRGYWYRSITVTVADLRRLCAGLPGQGAGPAGPLREKPALPTDPAVASGGRAASPHHRAGGAPVTEPHARCDRCAPPPWPRIGPLLALPALLEGPDVWVDVGSITAVTEPEGSPPFTLVEAAGQRYELLPPLVEVLQAVARASLDWRRELAGAEEEGRLLTRDAQRLPSLSRGNLDHPGG